MKTGSDNFDDFIEELELIEKEESKQMPYGYFYDVQSQYVAPDQDLQLTKDYTAYVSARMLTNSKTFLMSLNEKQPNDIAHELEVQFFYYKSKIKHLLLEQIKSELLKWLNYTSALINDPRSSRAFNEGNKYVKYEFHKWYQLKLEQIKSDSEDQVENSEERFYFADLHKLPQLYDALLKHNPSFIKENPQFLDSMTSQDVNPLYKTEWLGNQTQLFYLLFLLLGKKEFYKKTIPIPKLADSLFTFPKLKTYSLHSSQVNFNKIRKRLSEYQYLQAKQSEITELFDSVFK